MSYDPTRLLASEDVTNANWPLISIVTPCLNGLPFIHEAIQRVLDQGYPNVEHIVVDGGSTDGTLELLEQFPRVRVVGGPDKGVYDALNKGILLASGEIVGLLNTDDLYAKDALILVGRRFSQREDLLMVCGEAIVFRTHPEDGWIRLSKHTKARKTWASPRSLLLGKPFINSRFFRRRIFDETGLFDTRYRFAADRDLLIRMALRDIKVAYVDRLLYHYRKHPGSLTINPLGPNVYRMRQEHISLAQRYIRRADLPNDVRAYLRQWHSREALEMVLFHIRRGETREAMAHVRTGWLWDRSWPLQAASWVLRKAGRAVVPQPKTASMTSKP